MLLRKIVSVYYSCIVKLSDLFRKHAYWVLLKRKSSITKFNDFEKKIRKIWYKSNPRFGTYDVFYQSNPILKINGFRPTIIRFNNYNLMTYIDKNKSVLDIGGNTGFFSSYVAQFVKFIDLIEYDENLANIASMTIKYIDLNNVNIMKLDIKKFEPKYKYDIIFSFAIHKWVGESLESYLLRLEDLLDNEGRIIIESHPGEDEHKILETGISKSNFKIIQKGITDDHLGHLRYFYWLCKDVQI